MSNTVSVHRRTAGAASPGGRRLTRVVLAAAVGLLVAAPARAAAPFAQLLPGDTVAVLTIQDVSKLRQQWKQTRMGQALADPAMKPFLDDVRDKIRNSPNAGRFREQFGLSLADLFNLPQGQVAIAVRVLKQAEPGGAPVAVTILIDVGQNKDRTTKLMDRLAEKMENAGGKKRSEEVQGTTLTVIEPKDQGGEGARKRPPAIWFIKDTVLGLGTDVGTLKDLLGHWNTKAENSLVDNASYKTVLNKVGADAPVHWFLDFGQVINLVGAMAPGGQDPAQINAMLQLFGLDKLRAWGGSMALNTDKYDTVVRWLLQIEGKPAGLLRILTFPPSNLKPESWVPATVADYTTLNWDINAAWSAVSDVVNTFNMGALDNLMRNLGGAEGPQIDLKRDIIAPLGDRVTYITDFKKPITLASQRVLVAVSLKDSKTFSQTIQKLAQLLPQKPETRDFMGHTIYEMRFNVPARPPVGGANPLAAGGPPRQMAVTVAQDRVMVATDPGLLEAVLRQSENKAESLADLPAFQEIARDIPGQVSSLTFTRADEQARAAYDTLKGGQLSQAMQAASAMNPGLARLAKAIASSSSKLPDFSAIQKYLAPAGGYAIADEDGLYSVSFAPKKTGAGSE